MRLNDPALLPIREKIISGARLHFEDGMSLYRSRDLLGVGGLANLVRERKFGRNTYFVRNQHLNYTNICINRCVFCAFSRERGQKGAFTVDSSSAEEQIRSRLHEPIREIHMVGGLNPSLPFSYYLDLIRMVKHIRPEVTVKAFTAVEIDYFSSLAGLSIEAVMEKLKHAGLAMMPGGGAEILSERIHRKLYPKKIGPARWLEVIRTIHGLGVPTNATMLYGHIESLEERVEHFLKLRTLQDDTGGFSAFVPLAFHPENTRLSHLKTTGGIDDLKTLAVARLLLDNIPHIKAYWVMISPSLAQVALSFGADDLDGTIVEEKITHMAGAPTPKGMSRDEICHLICSAGYHPVERDAFYQPVDQDHEHETDQTP
jgi:aminodeoxyfutalosine synthase